MNEVDKMRSSQLANTSSPEIQERFKRAKKLLLKLNRMDGYDEEFRRVLEDLIPGIPASATIWPPFCCDHGDGIRLGEHVFINSNCTFWTGVISRSEHIRWSVPMCRFIPLSIRLIIWSGVWSRNMPIRWRLVRIAGLAEALLFVPEWRLATGVLSARGAWWPKIFRPIVWRWVIRQKWSAKMK